MDYTIIYYSGIGLLIPMVVGAFYISIRLEKRKKKLEENGLTLSSPVFDKLLDKTSPTGPGSLLLLIYVAVIMGIAMAIPHLLFYFQVFSINNKIIVSLISGLIFGALPIAVRLIGLREVPIEDDE